jgi:hypothetical protein
MKLLLNGGGNEELPFCADDASTSCAIHADICLRTDKRLFYRLSMTPRRGSKKSGLPYALLGEERPRCTDCFGKSGQNASFSRLQNWNPNA